jgi:hypothetical protein
VRGRAGGRWAARARRTSCACPARVKGSGTGQMGVRRCMAFSCQEEEDAVVHSMSAALTCRAIEPVEKSSLSRCAVRQGRPRRLQRHTPVATRTARQVATTRDALQRTAS